MEGFEVMGGGGMMGVMGGGGMMGVPAGGDERI